MAARRHRHRHAFDLVGTVDRAGPEVERLANVPQIGGVDQVSVGLEQLESELSERPAARILSEVIPSPFGPLGLFRRQLGPQVFAVRGVGYRAAAAAGDRDPRFLRPIALRIRRRVPAPIRQRGVAEAAVQHERLQPGHVQAKGEVAVADLQHALLVARHVHAETRQRDVVPRHDGVPVNRRLLFGRLYPGGGQQYDERQRDDRWDHVRSSRLLPFSALHAGLQQAGEVTLLGADDHPQAQARPGSRLFHRLQSQGFAQLGERFPEVAVDRHAMPGVPVPHELLDVALDVAHQLAAATASES